MKQLKQSVRDRVRKLNSRLPKILILYSSGCTKLENFLAQSKTILCFLCFGHLKIAIRSLIIFVRPGSF